MLHVGLDLRVVELAADETLGVKDSVDGVHRDLILRGVADKTLGVGEGDIGRGGAVTLVVGDDFHSVVLPDTDATVNERVSKVDSEQRKRTYE